MMGEDNFRSNENCTQWRSKSGWTVYGAWGLMPSLIWELYSAKIESQRNL